MTTRTGSYNQRRVWLGGGLVLGLVIALVGWLLVIEPELTDTAAKRDQLESVELQNTVLAAKNAKLKAENDDAAALRDSLSTALAELPADGGLPAFTRQLSSQATAHGVTLTSVIVGATATAAVADPAAAATPATIDDTATAATTGTTAATGPLQITVTVAASGLGRDLAAFLYDIQVTGPRRALVTATQLAPTEGSSSIGPDAGSTLDLTLSVFSAPMTADEQAALQKLLSGS
ncbi:hypothetical protein [Nakamurella deserti]|uniref:hypothetical protein n=1 Tax=Nakamurella deserti TaxID=2164074 RepID=UPI001300BDA2|nr:hypothetical protein [Nakamurella deserti]